MFKSLLVFSVLFILLGVSNSGFSQETPVDTTKQSEQYVVITKNDGSEFIGIIVEQDAREVLLRTKNLGDIYIPKHEIKQIDKISNEEVSKQITKMNIDELFATRYFISTNGFATPKGNHYAAFNLFGPEVHFAVSDKLTLGLMSSWIGSPIIFAPKYTFTSNESKVQFAVGGLLGTAGYISPEWGLAVPYGAITFGSKHTNINFAAGYGVAGDFSGGNNGSFLFSIGGAIKASRKLSFIFESMFVQYQDETYRGDSGPPNYTPIYTTTSEFIGLITPGVRYQTEPNKAFQFGFANVVNTGSGGALGGIPIPMVGWFRAL